MWDYDLPEEDEAILGQNLLDYTLVNFCESTGLGRVHFDYCGRFGTTQSVAERIIWAAFPQLKDSGRMELANYRDETSIE